MGLKKISGEKNCNMLMFRCLGMFDGWMKIIDDIVLYGVNKIMS